MTTHKDAEEWLKSNQPRDPVAGMYTPPTLDELAELLTAYASTRDAEIARLTKERDAAVSGSDVVMAWRAKMREKFGFHPAPEDPEKCACAYCLRDFESVAEHAAIMEMDVFCEGGYKDRAERAESSNVKLREIVEELAKQLRKIANYETNNESVKGLREWYRAVAKEALRRAQELSKQEGNK